MSDTQEKPMHHKTREKLEREAAAKAALEGANPPAPPETPAELSKDTPPADVFGEEPTPAQTPGEGHIFGKQIPAAPMETMIVDKNAWAQMMKMVGEFNELKGRIDGESIDPNNPVKKKKIIKVPFYVTEEGEEFIVTNLEDRRMIDGSLAKTWPRGRDDLTDQPITWCKPVLINLATNVQETREIRYDEFSNIVRTNPVEVKSENTVPVNLTTIPEEVEVASYGEKGGYLRRIGTGQLVKTAVWGVKSEFTVEWDGRDYVIDQSVANYK